MVGLAALGLDSIYLYQKSCVKKMVRDFDRQKYTVGCNMGNIGWDLYKGLTKDILVSAALTGCHLFPTLCKHQKLFFIFFVCFLFLNLLLFLIAHALTHLLKTISLSWMFNVLLIISSLNPGPNLKLTHERSDKLLKPPHSIKKHPRSREIKLNQGQEHTH